MAQITLTIPDAALPRVRNALCTWAGLPETNANAKEAVVQWIKATVQAVEHNAAVQAQPPIADVDTTGLVT